MRSMRCHGNILQNVLQGRRVGDGLWDCRVGDGNVLSNLFGSAARAWKCSEQYCLSVARAMEMFHRPCGGKSQTTFLKIVTRTISWKRWASWTKSDGFGGIKLMKSTKKSTDKEYRHNIHNQLPKSFVLNFFYETSVFMEQIMEQGRNKLIPYEANLAANSVLQHAMRATTSFRLCLRYENIL